MTFCRNTHPCLLHCWNSYRRHHSYVHCHSQICKNCCHRRNHQIPCRPTSPCGFCSPLPGPKTLLCLWGVCTLVHFLTKCNKIRRSYSECYFVQDVEEEFAAKDFVEGTGEWRRQRIEWHRDLYCEHMARTGENKNTQRVLMQKTGRRWKDNRKTEFKEIQLERMDWIDLACCCEYGTELSDTMI